MAVHESDLEEGGRLMSAIHVDRDSRFQARAESDESPLEVGVRCVQSDSNSDSELRNRD